MPRTQIAADNFDRANAAIGANWSYVYDTDFQPNPPNVVSNVCKASGGNRSICKWVGTGTFSNDQYATATLAGLGNFGVSENCGVAVRIGTGTNATHTGYYYYVTDNGGSTRTAHLMKRDANTDTALNSTGSEWANGDTIELEVEGNVLRAYKNGSLMVTYTDSASPLTTGIPGFMVDGEGQIDNWVGGDLTAAGGDVALSGSALTNGSGTAAPGTSIGL